MVWPTPSAPASASSSASTIASIEPNCRASARAAVGPTWRIDSATSTLHRGRDLAASRLSSSFTAFADSSPFLVVKRSTCRRASASRSNRSASFVYTVDSVIAAAAS